MASQNEIIAIEDFPIIEKLSPEECFTIDFLNAFHLGFTITLSMLLIIIVSFLIIFEF